MGLDYNLYLHDSDKAALAALKAIPGFSQVLKTLLSVWNEKQFKIENMSSNLRLGEKQMSKYYNMLPPICEKLGIEVPELYVTHDVFPNAYTYGDTNPFIVLTTGLFETIPDELIPTVLAHECGHIACHHTLYHTMGRILLSGALQALPGIANIAIQPILLAYAYWMRCSEYSADRVAAVCDGSADNTIRLCMAFAGYDRDISAEADVDLFIEQAEEYRELVKNDALNKTLEFIMFKNADHPLNAVRAYEIREWGNSDRFAVIKEFLDNPSEANLYKLPEMLSPKNFLGKQLVEVKRILQAKGFTNVNYIRTTDAPKLKPGAVASVVINNNADYKDDWYKKDSEIVIQYYQPKTEEEIANEHPFDIRVPESSKYYTGRPYSAVKAELEALGFTNIQLNPIALGKFSFFEKPHNVAKILVNGQPIFEKDSWFAPDAEIILYYYITL